MADLVQSIEALEFGGAGKVELYVVGKPFREGGPPVKAIGEAQPKGPGDVWQYQVIFEDDSVVRVFNHTRVFFGKPKPSVALPPKKKLIT